MLRPFNKAEVEFELLHNIGHEGCNSTVHIAHDRQLDAKIVVKKVSKADLPSATEFFEESRILYLGSHPKWFKSTTPAKMSRISILRCHFIIEVRLIASSRSVF